MPSNHLILCSLISSLWKWKLLSCVRLFAAPTGVGRMGSFSILQGIFPTQGSNPGLPLCRQILYQRSHQGSPRKLEWVAYPFSRGSSQPRNRTRVSCIAGEFFTNWAIREVLIPLYSYIYKINCTMFYIFHSENKLFIKNWMRQNKCIFNLSASIFKNCNKNTNLFFVNVKPA